jgi:Zn-dependent protease
MEITYLVPLFIAAWFVQMGVHEGGHAYVAHKLGDDTAYLLGKKSFNPLDHIEWTNINSILMSIVLPVITACYGLVPIGMAWVPVNPMKFRRMERDMALVSFAGPLANLIIVAVCFVLHFCFGFLPKTDMMAGGEWGLGGIIWIFDELTYAVCLTSALYGFFNLIPVPPLDGSKVLRYFLPEAGKDILDRIAPYGFFLLCALFWVGDASIIIQLPLKATMLIWALLGG